MDNDNTNFIPQDDEYEINLGELFFAIRSEWRYVLVSMIVVGLIMGAFCQFLMPDEYQADASLCITSNDSVINFNDLQVSSELTKDYEQIVTSRRVLKTVIKNLDMDITYQELLKMVTVNNEQDTHIVQILVTTPDKKNSIRIANEILYVSVTRIYQILGSSEPQVLDEAESDTVVNVKASTVKFAGIGALIGLLLVCLVVTLRVMNDTTLKNEEDIKRWLGYPVLAFVPFSEPDDGSKKK
jgi:Capsular polysaccharide biosynthesis protein